MSSSSSHSSSVAGLVMAGGQSERFGRDKARHPVEGVPMIRRVYEVLHAVSAPVIVSVGEEDPSYADVLPSGVPHVIDRHSAVGPLAGLEAGLSTVEAPWVLVAACDLPYVTPEGVRTLLSARQPDADAVVARTPDERWHPLFAVYRREPVREAVEACFEAETYALHALLDRLDVQAVTVSPELVHNVNRPSDLD